MSRCTGHCCERFNLMFSYEETQRFKESILNETFKFTRDSGEIYNTEKYKREEVLKIADMLIPLGRSYMDHNNEPMIENGSEKRDNGFEPVQIGTVIAKEANWFTCKNYNLETRSCNDYENRPDMCRTHPGCLGCNYKACTYKVEEQIDITGIDIKGPNYDAK